MSTDPVRFMCPGGMTHPQAIVLAKQIDADKPSAEALVDAFMPDFLAVELAKQIETGQPDIDRLAQLLVSPELADAIKTAIERRENNER